LNEGTEVMVLSRWEKHRPLIRILRVKKGELLVKIAEEPKPLEVETPVASARVKQTEFDIKVQEDGETTLRVLEGVVEFGTAFGTCLIRTGIISYGVRGKKCTKPKEENHAAALDWAKELVRK
jgi:ferric-dicitrate binding protein FerR (iron transport regulator)